MSKPLAVEPRSTEENTQTGTAIGRAPQRRRMGRYRIVSEIGRGGMANVYLALAMSGAGVNKLVVLKALRPEIIEEADSLKMFLDEARLAAQLNHPNVVQTYEVGMEGDRHVIVMEYLEGQPLSCFLCYAQDAGRPLPEGMYLQVLVGLLEGLHYAHELKAYNGERMNLVHRDVSPQNVFITYDGQTKVLDFGIAKVTTRTAHTTTGVVKGKIAYMAPEQMSGAVLDARADVFSVGCMLWACATGDKLWKDLPDVQVVKKVLGGEILNPRAINPKCSEELARITMKALAVEPERRYSTARELQVDIEKYIEQSGHHVKRRELGEFVAGLFGPVRAELSRHIEAQLAELANSDTMTPRGFEMIQQELRRVSAFPQGGATLASADPRASNGVNRGLIGLVGALLVGLGILGFTMWRKDESVANAPPSVASAPPVLPGNATATEAKATLRLDIEPTSARVELDGTVLPLGITAYSVQVREAPYRLRVSAPGFSNMEREFNVTGDMELAIKLESTAPTTTPTAADLGVAADGPRAPGAPSGRKEPVGRKPSVGPAPSPAPAAKAPDCSNMFYYDAKGIKKVRAECL